MKMLLNITFIHAIHILDASIKYCIREYQQLWSTGQPMRFCNKLTADNISNKVKMQYSSIGKMVI